MIFAALSEAAERGELLLTRDGMCRWHKRRDGIVVIREILILPFRRRTGLGRQIVVELLALCQHATVLARCPAGYESNRFWEGLGFVCERQKAGVNEWWLRRSSTVPMGTPPLPESP